MTDEIGALIISVEDKELTREERELLAHPLVGGVILFARNYDTREQLKHLCQSIRSARKTPSLIMVDQEGGRVQRFIHEFTRLPYMATFGKIHDENPDKAHRLAKDCAWLMAVELLSVGVDLSLAPVLDLNKGMNSVIGNRAFHSHPDIVIRLANAFIQGMHEAGMASTGKHFPGHGSVTLDSHIAMPIDERPMNEIACDDMVAFAGMINAGISALMAAHIIFPKVDKHPVGFSRVWLQEILRTRLAFSGAILSDDLNMEGANISSNYADRVEVAREAGCDFALLCNNHRGVIQVLDNLSPTSHIVTKEKWHPLRGNFSRTEVSYKENIRWQEMHEFLLRMDAAGTV